MADKLVMMEGAAAGAEHALASERVLLGSGEDCAIRDPRLGARHAQVERANGSWQVRALAPCALEQDGRALPTLKLEHGGTFSLNGVVFRYHSSKAAIERTAYAGKQFADTAKALESLRAARARILDQVASIVVGQRAVIEQVLVAMFAQGHCLLVGAPGLAKSLLARVLAGTLDLGSRRIQFTPDLMPSDIIGTDVLEEDPETRSRRFRFRPGPIFTNLLLADEINRTPPKTQAALLEAMQERRITAAGVTYDLPQPFLVLATQNPIEQEGTYPLPEAQLDRFMFCIHVDYPSAAEEAKILLDTTRDLKWEVERVLGAESILQFQHLVRQVPVTPHVAAYAAALIRATRPNTPEALDWITRFVRFGAGPRAGQYLLLAAKAHALLFGEGSVSTASVRAYAAPVLRHRIHIGFAAAAENLTSDILIERLLAAVPEPSYG